MPANPTATLWLFAYNGLTVGTHQSILQELRDWPNCAHWVQPGDALISRMRSKAAAQFLETERGTAGDVLLMVDHDIAWPSGDLAHIARRALERTAIVGGIYPKRAFGEATPVRFAAEGTWHIGEDTLIPARAVGSGFMAIPRVVLESLAGILPRITEGFWPFFLPMTYIEEGVVEYLSEDYAFCQRAQSAGYPVYASTYPRLTHEGPYIYRLVDARSRPPKDENVTLRLGPAVPTDALYGPGLSG